MLYETPFSPENTLQIYKDWIDIINLRETGSILCLPKRDQLYRVNQFVENQKLLSKYVVDYANKQLIILDPSSQMVENKKDILSYIEKHNPKGKAQIVLFILDADDILLTEKPHLLSTLNSLFYEKKHLSLLYFFRTNILLPQFFKQFSTNSTLYKHLSVFPLYETAFAKHFFDFMKNIYFDLDISNEIETEILKQCGGSFWLITEALRHTAKTNDAKNLFNHEGMTMRLNIMWNEFQKIE